MPARQGRGAETGGVVLELVGRGACDLDPALHVVQLADAELVAGAGTPAEEQVARRLHQSLTLDDPPAVVDVLARPDERREHRLLGFLHLQDERVEARAALPDHDEATRADRTDTDDLARRVDELDLVEQTASIVGQRPRVTLEEREHRRHRDIGEVLDDGRVVDDHPSAVAHLRQLLERTQMGPAPRLVDDPRLALVRNAAFLMSATAAASTSAHRRRAWTVAASSTGSSRTPKPITPRCAWQLCIEPQRPRREHHAGREPLQIHSPGCRQRLVEIVDVEHHLTFRRPEQAEVQQVRITARLHVETGRRCTGEIGRHDRRAAP